MRSWKETLFPHVQRFRDRHGKVRHYFRKRGLPRVALPGEPSSAEFQDAYRAALDNAPKPIGEDRIIPGSMSALIVAYYNSTEWSQLDADTRRTYRNMLDRFRDAYGTSGVKTWTPAKVRQMLDKRSATPGAARNLRKRLSKVFDFAVERGWRPDNPVRQVKPIRASGTGFVAWTEDDIARFLGCHGEGSRARVALFLLLYTGQRRSDVRIMGRQHVRGDRISVVQFKGRNRASGATRLTIPLHPTLRTAIDGVPAAQMTFVQTAKGEPFTRAGFTQWFGEMADKAGLPGLTPHGLRKAAGRRLAEAGCSAKQIASITGHKTLSEVERYVQTADQGKLAEGAMERLVNSEGQTPVSNLPHSLSAKA